MKFLVRTMVELIFTVLFIIIIIIDKSKKLLNMIF